MAGNGVSPVAGATVTRGEANLKRQTAGVATVKDATSAVTDSEGRFTLEGLPAGDATLTARRGNFTVSFDVSVQPGDVVTAPGVILEPEKLLGFIAGPFDSIEEVVMADGYEIEQVSSAIFEDPADAAPYGILFLNCNTNLSGSSADVITPNARAWMQAGGTLYVSDLSGETSNALIDGLDSGTGGTGSQTISAELLLDDMIDYVDGQTEVDILYDQGGWYRILELPVNHIALLEGTRSGQTTPEPLAVAIPFGEGRLVFTTFHNTANATGDMLGILRYFMYLG